MGNNKGTGLKIALIVVSAFFVISLFVNFYLYVRQYAPDSGLESQIEDLQNQVTNLQNLKNILQSEIENLKASKLVTRLGASDERPSLQTPYLHISGVVWNVGTNTAYNCKLHVILYQGDVIAKDTYIDLGTIEGEKWKDVDSKVYYEGSKLTEWDITREWD